MPGHGTNKVPRRRDRVRAGLTNLDAAVNGHQGLTAWAPAAEIGRSPIPPAIQCTFGAFTTPSRPSPAPSPDTPRTLELQRCRPHGGPSSRIARASRAADQSPCPPQRCPRHDRHVPSRQHQRRRRAGAGDRVAVLAVGTRRCPRRTSPRTATAWSPASPPGTWPS